MNAWAVVLTVCFAGQVGSANETPAVPTPKVGASRLREAAPRDSEPADKNEGEPKPAGRRSLLNDEASKTETPAGDDNRYGERRGADRNRDDRSREDRRGEAAQPKGAATTQRGLSSVHAGQQKLRPPELMAEALANVKEGRLKGAPTSLTGALARSTDRQQQIKIAQAYWNLAAAQANYHFELENESRLHRSTRGDKWEALARSARASSAAAVDDAELAVLDAQQQLAGQMNGTSAEELPLVIDRPHTGQYRTYFDDLFSGRTAPPRLQLIDRMLPTLRLSIDVHAEAIQAGRDAVMATADDLRAGDSDLDALLRALDELGREQRAFVAAARKYNQAIAEYALSVANPGEAEAKLGAMLIKNPATEPAKSSRPATAPRRPTASPAPVETLPDDSDPALQPKTFREGESDDGASSGSSDETRSEPDRYGRDLFGPSDTASGGRRVARKSAAEERNVPLGDGGIYQGLAQARPPLQAQKLAELLHWDRTTPGTGDKSQTLTLVRCLERTAPAARRSVIAAYWTARERAAVHQVLTEHADQLNLLSTQALELGTEQGSPTGMLRLRAARQAVRAVALDEQASLTSAQFDLAQLLGWNLREPWPMPITPPHAGGYRLEIESLARPISESAPVRRLARAVPMLQAELERRSAAIVFADVARSQMRYHVPHSLDVALTATRRQTDETLRFLRTLTEYNLAIADYALTVASPDIAPAKLVSMLVAPREEKNPG